MADPQKQGFASTSLMRVRVDNPPGPAENYEFRRTFRIGRTDDCDIRINNKYVSRDHVQVSYQSGQWQVHDLNSSNGMYVSGHFTQFLDVTTTATIRLGVRGPFVSFEVVPTEHSSSTQPSVLRDAAPASGPVSQGQGPLYIRTESSSQLSPRAGPTQTAPAVVPPGSEPVLPEPNPSHRDSLEHYIDHYFGAPKTGHAAGAHTMLVRMAFSRVQKRHKSRWLVLSGALILLVAAVSVYAWYERQAVNRQQFLAENIFYSMKSLEVDIANFERVVMDTNNAGINAQLQKYQERRRQMQDQYDKFLTSNRINDSKLTKQQRITLRIARIFGECELAMPSGFQSEIDKYIQQWKSSNRLAVALATARDRGYISAIRNELLAVDLPPQFFYLALQESNFDAYASGPNTRKGIAKGMWQFIPETAIQYGLRVGPLAELRRPDPGDDRHHWELETKAAARYLKDIYSGDAQASGLLVMACYNWGEDQVLPLVRALPANPGDRNFWRLLAKYRGKLPEETYSYVLSIISAAIIGEDPRLFGFDFDNPLVNTGN
jgi:membrane-bound lytic murein transglycosylase D